MWFETFRKDLIDMGHTPYGYRIGNGVAVIDEEKAEAVRMLFRGYLDGLGLQNAADQAGIPVNHSQAKRMMLNQFRICIMHLSMLQWAM